MQGDVYPVESSDEFSVNQILDAHWGYLYDGDVRTHSSSQDQCIYFCFFFGETYITQYPCQHIVVCELLSLLIDGKLNFSFQN